MAANELKARDYGDVALAVESAMIGGDLSKLSVEDRSVYYARMCDSIGLNPLTGPMQYIRFPGGKMSLYMTKDGAAQLRKMYGISTKIESEGMDEDQTYWVSVKVVDKWGHQDEDRGFACLSGLKGDARGNAKLKALTKAKRRATLSLCGLGFLDETEVDSIPGAVVQPFKQIGSAPKPEQIMPLLGNAQLDVLKQKMEKTNTTKESICNFLKINALEQMSEEQFEKVMNGLERKLEKLKDAKMSKSSNNKKEDKRSASEKLVDAFFEENLDTALKEFNEFLLTDFTRVMERFQAFAKERQESDFRMLNRLGMLEPSSIDKTAKEFSYDLQQVVNRFILDLRDARMDLIDMSAKTVLVCFKGANNDK